MKRILFSTGLLVLATLLPIHADEYPLAEKRAVAPVAGSLTGAETYTFTGESKVEFTGVKPFGSHNGGFKKTSGQFQVKNGVPVSGSFTIDMTSIWSDDEKLTKHLKNEDFFHVEKHPQSTFQIAGFQKQSETRYTVSGNFMMKGVTHNLTFPATVDQAGKVVKVSSQFQINRRDWGVSHKGVSDGLIRNKVKIRFFLVAVKR